MSSLTVLLFVKLVLVMVENQAHHHKRVQHAKGKERLPKQDLVECLEWSLLAQHVKDEVQPLPKSVKIVGGVVEQQCTDNSK